jgi:hypothetical protein
MHEMFVFRPGYESNRAAVRADRGLIQGTMQHSSQTPSCWCSLVLRNLTKALLSCRGGWTQMSSFTRTAPRSWSCGHPPALAEDRALSRLQGKMQLGVKTRWENFDDDFPFSLPFLP